jgi:hypothetical protein
MIEIGIIIMAEITVAAKWLHAPRGTKSIHGGSNASQSKTVPSREDKHGCKSGQH